MTAGVTAFASNLNPSGIAWGGISAEYITAGSGQQLCVGHARIHDVNTFRSRRILSRFDDAYLPVYVCRLCLKSKLKIEQKHGILLLIVSQDPACPQLLCAFDKPDF